MLYTTVELLSQVSSNFHLIFCFCNMIILYILMGSARSSTRSTTVDESRGNSAANPLSFPVDHMNKKSANKSVKDVHVNQDQSKNDKELEPPSQAVVDDLKGSSAHGDINDQSLMLGKNVECLDRVNFGEEEQEEEEKEGKDEDDELRRKIEEFIDKVNKEWRKEQQNTRYSSII